MAPDDFVAGDYVLTDVGWAFNLGVLTLVLGSLAVLAAIVRAGPARPAAVGIWLGVAWSAALTVIVLFPKHNWAVGPRRQRADSPAASIVRSSACRSQCCCSPVAAACRAAITRSRLGSRGGWAWPRWPGSPRS